MSDTASGLRAGLLALSALGIAGTLAELAALRHWDGPQQLVPWFFLAGAGVTLVLAVTRPSRRAVVALRSAGIILAAVGLYGVVVHIVSNMGAAPLDGVVGPVWAQMSLPSRLWAASTGGVGPAPPLSAAAMVPTGLAMALATLHHPALASATAVSEGEAATEPLRA